jgi:hypothetical protein
MRSLASQNSGAICTIWIEVSLLALRFISPCFPCSHSTIKFIEGKLRSPPMFWILFVLDVLSVLHYASGEKG